MKKKTKILVVDDENIVRESLRDWLINAGYKVEIAESGEKALQIIKQNKIKIMLARLLESPGSLFWPLFQPFWLQLLPVPLLALS